MTIYPTLAPGAPGECVWAQASQVNVTGNSLLAEDLAEEAAKILRAQNMPVPMVFASLANAVHVNEIVPLGHGTRLAKQAIVATISTGGKAPADELGYDPLDHIILIANASDRPPFLTFISADTHMVLGQVTYPSTQIGLEQPVWSKLTKRFYVTVPSSSVTPGSIDVYNPLTMQREQSFPVWGCSPAGLALTPNQHLMTSCGVVVEGRLGGRVATVFGVGGDEIWYNPGDNRYYIGAAVVDADTNQVIATLPVPPGMSVRNASVDSETNRVFAPATAGGVPAGVMVFAAQ